MFLRTIVSSGDAKYHVSDKIVWIVTNCPAGLRSGEQAVAGRLAVCH
jgi:hypothetical protein